MDPEQLREFEESIRRINEMLTQQTVLQASLLKGMKDQLDASNKDTIATNNSVATKKREAETTQTVTKLNEAEAKSKALLAKSVTDFSNALHYGKTSVTSFASALLSSEKGLSKYAASASALGDGIRELSKDSNFLGETFGRVGQATSKLLAMQLQQLDAQLNLKNQLSKMGQAGGVSTQQLSNLAKQAGYSYQDLQKLSKPLQTASGAMATLTTSTTSGAETFLTLAKHSKDTQVRFEKLGFSLEELTDAQAQYLDLQRMSGAAFRDQTKDANTLRKNSLEYAENLVKLSALTGKTVEETANQQRLAKLTFEENVAVMAEGRKMRRLEAEAAAATARGDTGTAKEKIAQRDAIAREAKQRDELIMKVSAINATVAHEMAQAFRNKGMTGEGGAGLSNLGFTPTEIRTLSPEKLASLYAQRVGTVSENMQYPLGVAGEGLGKSMGFDNQAIMDFAKISGMSEAEIRARMAKATSGGTIPDAGLDAQTTMTQQSRAAKRAVDDFLTNTNMVSVAVKAVDYGLTMFQSGLEASTPVVKKFTELLQAAVNVLDEGTEKGFFDRAKDWASGLLGMGGKDTGAPSARAPAGSPGPAATGSAAVNQLMASIALAESSGNPKAKNTESSASGVFQFTKDTWQGMVKQMGKNYTLADRFDPVKSAEVMRYFTQQNKTSLEKGIGRGASVTDLYMAHFLGSAGATNFLNVMANNPNASAADVVARLDPLAPQKNKSIFYDKNTNRPRTLQEVYNIMAGKMSSAQKQLSQGKGGALAQSLAAGKVSAASGAYLDGPSSGFPVDLTAHGTEIIAPLQKNSILMELANTPLRGAGSVDASTALMSVIEKNSMSSSSNIVTTSSAANDRVLGINIEMMQMLSNKLDRVIDTLAEGNDTSSKLLKRSSV